MSQQRKFFPGWLVVVSGFVIMATCYIIFVNCMSLFQPLIVSDLGISLRSTPSPTPTSAASKQFGMADLGKVTGTITSFEMVGGTVGAIVSGILFDATGSFTSTWIVCLACSVAMLVFLLASEPIAAKLRASVAGE